MSKLISTQILTDQAALPAQGVREENDFSGRFDEWNLGERAADQDRVRNQARRCRDGASQGQGAVGRDDKLQI